MSSGCCGRSLLPRTRFTAKLTDNSKGDEMAMMTRRAVMGSASAALTAATLKPRFAHAVDDFTTMDAVGMAAAIRRKQVTPRELVDAAIARIEAANPKLNAVVT